jgi:putative serine protease PepD
VLSALLAAGIVLAVLYLAPPALLQRWATPGAPVPPAASAPAAQLPAGPLPAAQAAGPAAAAGSPAAVLAPVDDAIARLYEEVGPAVVNITTTAFGYDIFRFAVVPQQGSGSGFLIDEDGNIATNEHVVRDASELEVTLADGTKLPARLVGRDPITDLAVVHVDLPAGTRIRPIPLADSSSVRVGQSAIAIGNPFGFQRTITTGVVSSSGRTLRANDGRQMRGVLQTDAAINPGNSGGPLLNARGEAIGINSMIFSPSGGSVGVGFAIASNTARRWLPELVARGRASHPWAGFEAQPVTPRLAEALRLSEKEGLLLATVPAGSPAAQAGLRGGNRQVRVGNQRLVVGGDVVTAVDGRRLADPDALDAYLEDNKRVGDTVRLDYVREGRAATVELRLGERPG